MVVSYRDDPAATLRCLAALERQQHGLDVTVALVDRGGEGISTRAAVAEWIEGDRRHVYVLDEPAEGEARGSVRALHGAVARRGEGRDLVLFLDGAVELRSFDCLQTMAMQALADRDCGAVGIKLLAPGGREVREGGLRLVEEVRGSGYYRIEPAQTMDEFVGDEHVVFAVGPDCLMIRRPLYEELGGLDGVLYRDRWAAVDLCCRAAERGHRNYYYGTLAAYHHGDPEPRRSADEAEVALLHERHAATLAAGRLRHLTHTYEYAWPRPLPAPPPPEPAPPPPPVPEPQIIYVPVGPAELPLRYKIVDRVHRASTAVVPRPVHRLAKRVIVGSWRAVGGRPPAAEPAPPPRAGIYRRFFGGKARTPRP